MMMRWRDVSNSGRYAVPRQTMLSIATVEVFRAGKRSGRRSNLETASLMVVWGAFVLIAIPVQQRLGVDWRFARFMNEQVGAPLGLGLLGFYGMQALALYALQKRGAFRNGVAAALVIGFLLLIHFAGPPA